MAAIYVGMKDKGIEFAKQAVVDDEAERYPAALIGYKTALDYFTMYMKYEKNPKMKDSVMKKVGNLMAIVTGVFCYG